MVDTRRDRVALEQLLKDNDTEQISPQDMRDVLASVVVVTTGSGIPTAPAAAIGDRYIDTFNKEAYEAVSLGNSPTTDDWRKITFDNGWRGAIISKSSASAQQTPIEFDQEVEDTEGFIDLLTYPSRITIPSSITKVWFSFGMSALSGSTGTPNMYTEFRVNGVVVDSDDAPGLLRMCEGGYSNWVNTMTTGVVDVTPGDYWEVYYNTNGDLPSSIFWQVTVVE